MSSIALVFLSALLMFWAFPPSTAESRLRKFCIGQEKKGREAAVGECKNNYTDLATVYDQQDNMELSKLLKGTGSGWIGIFSKGNSSKKWSNGDDVTYNSDVTGYCEECCAAMKADGQWEFVNCSLKRHFMCYGQDVGRESYNYSLISENKTWYEAQLSCRENHKDLVSIRNEMENKRVMEAGEQSIDPFWIGLLEDSWEWDDGGQSAYRNWKDISKNLKSEVYMDVQGKWHKNGHGENFPLCYKSFIHVSPDKMSWEKALDYCNSNYSGLLRIESENDQTETEREIRRSDHNITGPVWVGLRQSRLFGFWIWTNGLHMGNWSNWKGGRQPEHQMSEYCGAIEKVDGQYKWCDKDCRSEFTVLCEENRELT